MSDESIQSRRKPTDAEQRLLTVLWSKAGLPKVWLNVLEVQPMNDGGMGSLRLVIPDAGGISSAFGKQAAEVLFEDTDGVKVIASLNLDKGGVPFELDIWKTDFSPLLSVPDVIGEKHN